jgi:anti-sigma B factor antagonist
LNLKDLAKAEFKAPKKRSLDISEEMVSGILVMHFSGDLDIKTLPKAKEKLEALFDDVSKKSKTKPAKGKAKGEAATGPLRVIIDLEDVEYIDSSGLGFFIGSLKKLKEHKGDLKLAHLNAYMMGIFKLINMHYIIEIHENIDKAIKSFGSPRRAATSSTGKNQGVNEK